MKKTFLSTVRDLRAPIYLQLGTALAVGAPVVSSVALTGCADEERAPVKGVTTIIKEVAHQQYVIEDEKVTDGPSRLVIMHLDGRVENIVDPNEFAKSLPAQPPPATYQPAAHASGGIGLGELLLFSMLMDTWRPPVYQNHYYRSSSSYYASPRTYERVQTRERVNLQSYQKKGLAPKSSVEAKSRQAAKSGAKTGKAQSPTRGKSGALKGGSSRGSSGG